MRCQLAVEVAKDALAGAVLRFPAQLAGDETADDVVEIDPRWSVQDAASLASTSSTIALRQAEAAS
ncbi:hypothetical protein [Acidipropionibacterium timonense]|uniref:hypothetical protein n=1 Tax=Acidipropionibacterium timonense TaxID=2161818 RepID=UPI001030283D|nr:hypothetical protein [Acidipropionibacterium timonense]